MGLENPLHIVILLVVVLLVFGAKRLPEMGRGLGQGLREFKASVTGTTSDPALPAEADAASPGASEPARPGASDPAKPVAPDASDQVSS